MRYLVTGGCGFIGSNLVRHLLAQGHHVVIMDNLSNAIKESAPMEAILIVRDVTQPHALDTIIPDVDGIFHLAAIVSVTQSVEKWRDTHEVTLGGTVAVFDAVARLRPALPVVYASSAAVYGNATQTPFVESTSCKPISAYGADKLACEMHAHVGSVVHSIASVGLRFFNVYGNGQDPSSPYAGVISIFADRMRQNLPISIYGDGNQTRDYIYVDDVSNSMILAMNKLKKTTSTQDVFNICTGRPVTLNQLAATIATIFSSTSEIKYKAARPGDIVASLGEPAAARLALGFEATTDLKTGLEKMLKA